MYFILTFLFTFVSLSVWIYQSSEIIYPRPGYRDHYSFIFIVIMMFTVFMISMPVTADFMQFMFVEQINRYHGLTSYMQSISVWSTGAGGLLAILFSVLTGKYLKQKRLSYNILNLSFMIVSLLAGVVAVTSAYKHLTFFSGDKAGVLSYQMIPAINDIDCNQPVLLVKWEPDSKEPTAWRCPAGVVLNDKTSSPFIPWGSYTEGKSSKLSEVMAILMKNAVKIE